MSPRANPDRPTPRAKAAPKRLTAVAKKKKAAAAKAAKQAAAEAKRAPQVRPELSGRQRRQLRGLAHELKPIVNVGHQGVTEALLASVDKALLDHELIKVKVNPNNDDEIPALAEQLGQGARAAVVQHIGRIVVLYRPHPETPVIVLER